MNNEQFSQFLSIFLNFAAIFQKKQCSFLEFYQIRDKFYDFLKNLAEFRQNFIKIWLQKRKIQSKNAEN